MTQPSFEDQTTVFAERIGSPALEAVQQVNELSVVVALQWAITTQADGILPKEFTTPGQQAQAYTEWYASARSECSELYRKLAAEHPDLDRKALNEHPELKALNTVQAAVRGLKNAKIRQASRSFIVR